MKKTLIGFVTFGQSIFTELMIESIINTTVNKVDMFAIIGKPSDNKTKGILKEFKIPYKVHNKNYGFPYSINDIYDYAWKENNYDNLIIAGNDIIAYPFAIDSLINFANNSDYDMVSALQYDVRDLTKAFPKTKQYFEGNDYKIYDFSSKCWNNFTDYGNKIKLGKMLLYDIQNLCLYKKSVFDSIGYTDVNYFPAYFIDNDYARRIVLSKLKYCSLLNARFFHFWSRTMKQGSGGSNSKYFENNRNYYISKWGGDVGNEVESQCLTISTREKELEIIDSWR